MADEERNRVKCKRCGDVIESLHQHDFKTCKCGSVSIDGGWNKHWRRLWPSGDRKDWIEEMP